MLAVRKNVGVLIEGVGLLNAYHSELTDDAVDRVRVAHTVMDVQLAQLYAIGGVTPELADVAARVTEQLKQTRPWRDIAAIEDDVETLRKAYAVERGRRIERQELLTAEAEERVKGIRGYAELDDEQRHQVLRPVRQCVTETTVGAVAPALNQLLDGLELRLREAETLAEDRVDELRNKDGGDLVVKVTIEIRNREIRDEKDVDALLDEIRTRLMQQLDKGHKVRLRLS